MRAPSGVKNGRLGFLNPLAGCGVDIFMDLVVRIFIFIKRHFSERCTESNGNDSIL